LFSYATVIFNQNNLASTLQRNLFSDDVFTAAGAGQPVTYMTSQQWQTTMIHSILLIHYNDKIKYNINCNIKTRVEKFIICVIVIS